MLGLLISRRLQNGLASCRTEISDHVLGSWKVNPGRCHSFRSSVFLLKVDNSTVGCVVVLFWCFVSELICNINCCETSSIAVLRGLAQRIRPVLQQIRLLQVAKMLCSV